MVCPFCLHEKTQVYNSRQTRKLNQTWRRRRCEACGREFTTREHADPGTILKVYYGRIPKPFSHAKILLSIARVCDHRDDVATSASYITETVEQGLYLLAAHNTNKITPQDIAHLVLQALQPYDVSAYVKYLSYHELHVDHRELRRRLKR